MFSRSGGVPVGLAPREKSRDGGDEYLATHAGLEADSSEGMLARARRA